MSIISHNDSFPPKFIHTSCKIVFARSTYVLD